MTSAGFRYDNRTGGVKVWGHIYGDQDPAEAREKIQAENPAWLQQMTAMGYTWEDVFVPYT